MSYQVLARRWRPKRFDEVVGQDHVTRTLKNAIKQGRLAHGFLFTGPRGVGKTSTARILARAVNCPNVDLKGDPEPCNECETCRALLEDREMDVIEMDAASYRGIDDVRRISEVSRMGPVAGTRKVYIIDEVHMFTREAFNAFLKTLEEPPPHVIFVLATTDVQKVPATILSRVQRFDFRPVQPADVAPHLAKICEAEGWEAEPEALWLIARRGEGSLRDAEGLLDQVVSFGGNRITYETTREILGVLSSDLLAETTRLLAEQRLADVPGYLEKLVQRGIDYTELLRALQGYWMDLIFLKQELPLKGRPEEEIAQMQDAGTRFAVEDLFRLIRMAESLEDSLKWSTAPRVRFEVSFLRWATLDRAVTIREILDRIGPGGSGTVAAEKESLPATAAAPKLSTPPAGTVPKPVLVPVMATAEIAPNPPDPASHTASLEDLKALWPEIVKGLQKRNPAAAAQAQSHWELEAFDGRRLSVRCTKAGIFHEEQMKENFPHLVRVIHELTGMQVVALAAAETAPAVRQTASAKPAPQTPAVPPHAAAGEEKDDLFKNFINRVDGVEVDPKTLPGGRKPAS